MKAMLAKTKVANDVVASTNSKGPSFPSAKNLPKTNDR
jgi:hypothetical protein